MEIYSPKDGFVVEIKPLAGKKVEVNEHLLTMDTDDEDRDIERVAKMERVRLLMAAQYDPPELEVTRRMAQIAVEIADENVKQKLILAEEQRGQNKLGVTTTQLLAAAEAQYRSAVLSQEKAVNDLKKFEFAVARHRDINAVVKTFMESEERILQTKRTRLKVLAPRAGTLTLHVGVNSFVARGHILLDIK